MAGGYEPDELEQTEIVELWHLSKTALAYDSNPDSTDLVPSVRWEEKLRERFGSVRRARISWVVEEFVRANVGKPNVAAKWIYCWAIDNLGLIASAGTIAETYRAPPKDPGRVSRPKYTRKR